MSNENNDLNFEEIEGHCRILQAKLSRLTERDQASASALEDLCDYYERGIQLRIMQNSTLTEQIKELKTAHDVFVKAVVLWAFAAAGVAALCLMLAYPAAMVWLVGQYWSHAAVGAVSMAATAAFSGKIV